MAFVNGKMAMKKIALVMESWKHFFTYAWAGGILQRLRETNEDVNLYIFNSAGGWSRDEEYKAGEYNIFRLPDFADFDGIVLDLNNMNDRKVCSEVIERVRASGTPAVSIANELDGFYYVGINNYAAMREMIVHLHRHHGCRRFWFIMGPECNYENRQRTAALKDYVAENRLPCSEEDFYFESYDYLCGVHGFEYLFDKRHEIPDAIVCCNDNIVVGVCEAAAQHGFHAPGDFLVTGFDNFDKASYYMPNISTVEHIREEVGYQCAELFLRLWSGEEVPRFHYTNTEHIFWESCGCCDKEPIDARSHLKNQIMYGIETNRFEEDILALDYELMKCNTVADMMNCIPQCIPAMKCDAMYLVLDKHMDAFKNAADIYHCSHLINNEGFLETGYPKDMQIKFAYEDGRVIHYGDTTINSIFPFFDYPEGGKDFLFLPLHFRSRTVGYFAIRNAVYLMEKQFLFQVVKALTDAMENLHKKEILEYMNETLSGLSVKDAMTGVYNRRGYQKLAEKFLRETHAKGKSALILFIDLDRLKYINDNYGHSHGDSAIIAVADIILKHCAPNSIPARTGGDEFILIQEAAGEEAVRTLTAALRKDIRERGIQLQLPFAPEVSIGVCVTDPSSPESLEDYIKQADEIMYEEKTMKKVERRS